MVYESWNNLALRSRKNPASTKHRIETAVNAGNYQIIGGFS